MGRHASLGARRIQAARTGGWPAGGSQLKLERAQAHAAAATWPVHHCTRPS